MFSQQPDQKNLILAIVLSMGVLLAWQYFYAGPKLKEEQARQALTKQQQAQQPAGAPNAPPTSAPTSAAPAATQPSANNGASAPSGAPTAEKLIPRDEALKASPRIPIETGSLSGTIALRGGRLDDLSMVRYHETVDKTSPRVKLFSPAGTADAYFAEKGWSPAPGVDQPTPGPDTVWTAETKGALTPTSPVMLSWNNGKGLIFRRTIRLDENYMFTLSDEVENTTGAPVTLYPYGAIQRHGTPKVEGYAISHEGPIGVIGSVGLKEFSYAELTKEVEANIKKNPADARHEKKFEKMQGGWLGITDKYWAAALIPSQTMEYQARVLSWRAGGRENFQVDYMQPGVTIPAGGKSTADTMLFAGAKEVRIVDGYKATFGIKQFESIIDWGMFWYFTKPLFHVIDWIYRIVKNFGVAILIVTVLVKLLFFPLANKSYDSMAKMKKLQPEMERIRERYKDDKARQQQEMMALYQKEKINPLAGCLPIMVQIPVFFALYKVLFVTIDMRHAPFFGWIKDLAAPDPTSITNLFGLLPWGGVEAWVLGYTIGAWAIVMGITMWLQMQLNPQQPDPMQQAIFSWMPVMFTIMLGGFASGLVIYWAWSNLLSIGQQWLIMKKNNVEVPLMDNLRKQFAPIGKLFGR